MQTSSAPLLKTRDIATRYDMTESSVYRLRCYHPDRLPPAIKIGSSVRWRLEDVEKWEAEQVKNKENA